MNFGIHGVRSIEDFMREWARDEFLDMSVLHLVLDWLQGHLPLNARNRLLTRRGVRGSMSDQVSASYRRRIQSHHDLGIIYCPSPE